MPPTTHTPAKILARMNDVFGGRLWIVRRMVPIDSRSSLAGERRSEAGSSPRRRSSSKMSDLLDDLERNPSQKPSSGSGSPNPPEDEPDPEIGLSSSRI